MKTYRIIVSELGNSSKYICFANGAHYLPGFETTSDSKENLQTIAEGVLDSQYGIIGTTHTFKEDNGLIKITFNSVSLRIRKGLFIVQAQPEIIQNLTGDLAFIGLVFLKAEVQCISDSTKNLIDACTYYGFRSTSAATGLAIEAILTNCEQVPEGIKQFERLIVPHLPDFYNVDISAARDGEVHHVVISRNLE